ncbi:MAG TPA: aminoglycoside phosphotransferase family protein [Candidatus Dormibacteraeota bacterium]|nr:aminoglycoside phosphotransferase family protein [Candidatus Dormibacteraeota bacterium]
MSTPLLPDDVREHIQRFFGDRGRAWIAALPELVADLARRWDLRIGDQAYGGGSHSLVVPATRADGTAAVLKLPVQDEENRNEAVALRLYAGEGATLLYEADAATGALLLERLVPGTPLYRHPDREYAIDVACALLCRLRRPLPAGHPFRPVPDLVDDWHRNVAAALERYGDPIPPAVLREVLAAIEALAAPAGEAVLVNRDAHMLNILAAEREPWLLIDPKPLAGEPAFDGGWLLLDQLRDMPVRTPADARRLSRRIADGLGVDPSRVRAWALARAAENVVWHLNERRDPDLYLSIATALADAP